MNLYVPIISLSLLSLLDSWFAPKTVVKGFVTKHAHVNNRSSNDLLLIEVKLKVGGLIIASSNVQQNGSFVISNGSSAVADLVYGGLGINGDVYLGSIPPSLFDTLKLKFELPISAAKTRGRITCPKCKRRDKVLPIDGQAGVVVTTVSTAGQIVHLPYDKKHYYPDSDVSNWLDPHWYCVRDAIKF